MENKTGQKRKWKTALLGLMFAFLCIPFLGILVSSEQVYPITENRERGQRPGLSLAWQALIDDGQYCRIFEAWFNDNFQFRDLMIRTKNELQYSLFGQANGVYVGDDDYLFYRSVVANEQIRNEQLPEDYFPETEALLLELRDRAEAIGAQFYCMFPPQKNTVMPERTEELPVVRPTPNRYDQWREFLKASELADGYIDVFPLLQEAESNYPTYYRTDFHWNSYGATVAFTELVNRIAGEELFSEDQYHIENGELFLGGQLNNFSTLRERGETYLQTVKNNGEITMLDRSSTGPNLPMTRYYRNEVEAPLGKILIVGDSYTLYFLDASSGIADCFSEIYYVNINSVKYSNWLSRLEYGQVDYVLFERIESGMYGYEYVLRRLLGEIGDD